MRVMTHEDLQRYDAELSALVAREDAPAVAREHARSFNQSISEVRAALLEPARDLGARGRPLHELPACLEKAVAELAFWRRVLLKVHGPALGPDHAGSEYLVRYLRS